LTASEALLQHDGVLRPLRASLLAALAATPVGALPSTALADEGGWPDLGTPATVADDGRKDAAVIIGIDEYAFVPHVPGATHNATDWLTFLTESRHVPIDRVQLLRDVQGTREGILKAATQAAKQVEAGGTLWFVFIGHGAPGPGGNDGLLVGADAQQSADSIFARSVTQSEVLTRLAVGPSSAHRVLVVDACFSGRSGTGEALAAGLQPMLAVHEAPVAGAIVLSAGAADQFAGPLPGAGRPAFSYLVLGALRGWAAEPSGEVTAEDAINYSRQVLRTLPIGRLQEPRVSGSSGRFVLVKHATEKAPNLHDIVVHGSEAQPPTGGLGLRSIGPFGGAPAVDEGQRAPGAIHASFSAPLGDAGVWTLHDPHAKLCKLPCTRWVVPGPGFELVRESPIKGEAEVHVTLPPETPFREGADVNEQLVAPRGSLLAGGIVTGLAAGAIAGGSALIYVGANGLGSSQSSSGLGPLLGGTTLATAGLIALIWGIPTLVSSHDWKVEATPGGQGPLMFHFSPQALEVTRGATRVSISPSGVAGVF
jgi:hypothetical protein